MPEVAGLAMDTVAQMVRHAGPAAVRPHLPLLVGSLLESLSTLEVRCSPLHPAPTDPDAAVHCRPGACCRQIGRVVHGIRSCTGGLPMGCKPQVRLAH